MSNKVISTKMVLNAGVAYLGKSHLDVPVMIDVPVEFTILEGAMQIKIADGPVFSAGLPALREVIDALITQRDGDA